jgi:hypothetical protein
MALGLEHANGGSAASVTASASNQGWSRDLELLLIEASRERAASRSLASEFAT